MEKQRESAQNPVTMPKQLAFGLAAAGNTLQNNIMNTYYMYFLTNSVGMTPALMGVITSTQRALSLIWPPFRGGVLNSMESKNGKYRRAFTLFWPLGMFFYCLCFINIQAAPGVQFAYYVVMYLIGFFLTSFMETSHLALASLMSPTKEDAVKLTSIRSAVATGGSIFHSLFTTKLVTSFGQGDKGKGYLGVYILYTVISIICCWLTAWSAKDYDLYKVDGEKETVKEEKIRYPLSVYLEAFFKNRPLITLFVCDILKATATMVYTGAVNYYYDVVVGDFSTMRTYFLSCNIMMLVGSLFTPYVVKLVGKKMTNVIAYGGFAIALICGAFVMVGNPWGIIICIGVGRIFSGLNGSVSPAMYGEISAWWENKTGYNLRAYIMTFFSMNFNIAQLFTSIIVASCLTAVGYTADAAITPQIYNMCLWLMSLIPGVPLLIGALLFTTYPLTEAKMDEVRAELAAKNAN